MKVCPSIRPLASKQNRRKRISACDTLHIHPLFFFWKTKLCGYVTDTARRIVTLWNNFSSSLPLKWPFQFFLPWRRAKPLLIKASIFLLFSLHRNWSGRVHIMDKNLFPMSLGASDLACDWASKQLAHYSTRLFLIHTFPPMNLTHYGRK